MSMTIMLTFEDKDLKYLACTHTDSFSVAVGQHGVTTIWFSAPSTVKEHETSYRWLVNMLNDMKKKLTKEYQTWKKRREYELRCQSKDSG